MFPLITVIILILKCFWESRPMPVFFTECVSVPLVCFRQSGLNVPSKHRLLPGQAAKWKNRHTFNYFCSLMLDGSWGLCSYKTFLIYHDQVWYCGSSRKYEPNLFPIITEQRDSNLWCNVIVMITCDIIVKSGKYIIAVNIKVLKENVTWLLLKQWEVFQCI